MTSIPEDLPDFDEYPEPDALTRICPACGAAAEWPDCDVCGFDFAAPQQEAQGTGTNIDWTEAERFLGLIDPEAETWCFRTIHHQTKIVTKYGGTLEQCRAALERDHAAGRGLFVVINEGGQDSASIRRVRAAFADFDLVGSLPESFDLEPSIIVSTSPGKAHTYWLVDDLPLDQFTPMQKAIIARFGSDPGVFDLPRVMRLPGSLHRKDPAHPYPVRIIHEAGGQPYSASQMLAAFPPLATSTTATAAPAPGGGPLVIETNRHGDVLNLAARLARAGMAPDAAFAAMSAERARGRWTRTVDDGELLRAIVGATGKIADGTWAAPPIPDHVQATADALVQQKAAPAQHPLSRIIPMGGPLFAPDWIIPGVVEAGVITVAGARGVGKTTSVYPLACVAAGIHEPGYPLAPHPDRWRHVLYVSEHPAQVQRIAAGLAHHLGITTEEIGQRVHLVEAVRMAASYLVEVGPNYREQFTRKAEGVELSPLVVLDTQAATIALENENDNAEASAAIAALKQRFEALPVWIIAHVAKGDLNRRNAHELTARGAGAIEADAVGCLYLVKDGDGHDADRWLVLGKHRFETGVTEWHLSSHTREVEATNAWGEVEPTVLRWSIARVPDKTRAERAADAETARKMGEESALRMLIVETVSRAWDAGEPLNRKGVQEAVKGRRGAVYDVIAELVEDGRLFEVHVPSNLRTNPARSVFLVALTEEERDRLKATGEPPQREIPPSWRKPETGTDGDQRAEPEQEKGPLPLVPDSLVPLRKKERGPADGAPKTRPSCSDSLNVGTDGDQRGPAGTGGDRCTRR